MREKPIDKETARYLAIRSIADLLRDTTEKTMITKQTNSDGSECTTEDILDSVVSGKTIFSKTEFNTVNTIFTDDEHKDVKRLFLRLCNEL